MADRNRTPKSITAVQSRSEEDSRPDTGSGSLCRALSKGGADIRDHLSDHMRDLRSASCAVTVCVQALQQQAADADEEIALVLQRMAGDKLAAAIERAEEFALGLEQPSAWQ